MYHLLNRVMMIKHSIEQVPAMVIVELVDTSGGRKDECGY